MRTFCESSVHFDFTHLSVHMTRRFVIQGCPTLTDVLMRCGLHSQTAIPQSRYLTIRKEDRFFGPNSTWTVENLLNNVATRMPLMPDFLPSSRVAKE